MDQLHIPAERVATPNPETATIYEHFSAAFINQHYMLNTIRKYALGTSEALDTTAFFGPVSTASNEVNPEIARASLKEWAEHFAKNLDDIDSFYDTIREGGYTTRLIATVLGMAEDLIDVAYKTILASER